MLTNKILFTINSLKNYSDLQFLSIILKRLILIRKNSLNLKKYSN